MSDAVMELRESVAAEVRALMGRHRVTQVSLAESTGISRSQLSRCLGAKEPFDLDQLVAIARYFDLPISRLIEISPESCWTADTDQLTFDLAMDDVTSEAPPAAPVLAIAAA